MDGKSGAEELIGKVLNDPALLQSLASQAKPAAEGTGLAPGLAEGTPAKS